MTSNVLVCLPRLKIKIAPTKSILKFIVELRTILPKIEWFSSPAEQYSSQTVFCYSLSLTYFELLFCLGVIRL